MEEQPHRSSVAQSQNLSVLQIDTAVSGLLDAGRGRVLTLTSALLVTLFTPVESPVALKVGLRTAPGNVGVLC